MSDALTVLRCRAGRRAAKLVRPSGQGVEILGYDAGRLFSVRTVGVDGIEALAGAAERVSRDPRAFVVRGAPRPGIDTGACRRLLHGQSDGTPPSFEEVPRRSLFLDFDSVDRPMSWDWRDGALSALSLRASLPAPFHGVSFWWQFTGGAGFRPGLRMRLAFWLDRAVTGAELGRWLAAAPVDHTVFRCVQPIYLARPLLRGVPDPVPERSGLEWDVRDEVQVPELRPPEPVKPPAVVTVENLERRRSLPAARHGWPYALLEEVATAVATTPVAGRNRWNGGGRHHALYCAALRLSRPISEGHLPRSTAEEVLAVAAVQAGLGNEVDEVARTIRNGFRRGGLPA